MFICTKPVKATYLTKEQIRRKLNKYLSNFGPRIKDRLKVNDPRLTDAFCRRIARELGKAYGLYDEDDMNDREARVLWTGVAILGIDPRCANEQDIVVLPTKWPERWPNQWNDMLPN